MNNTNIVLFRSRDGDVTIPVSTDKNTVWLTRQQMAELFDRDVKTIGRHIQNALREELDLSTVAKSATVQQEGGRTVTRSIAYYSLDMIISVGYRVKSNRGVEFRRWANEVLKQYVLQGYAANDQRLKQLDRMLRIMQRVQDTLDSRQVLAVVERYSAALSLLDAYDHQTLGRPAGSVGAYVLTYRECREIIDSMSFGESSALFGNEKDDSFRGSIGNIYQTFGGAEVYPTTEEKAANLLYFITKNHSFSDGNKRIAATLFLHFLNCNGLLFDAAGEKRLDDRTLVALTIMIAESRPEEKETMISVIMNCIGSSGL